MFESLRAFWDCHHSPNVHSKDAVQGQQGPGGLFRALVFSTFPPVLASHPHGAYFQASFEGGRSSLSHYIVSEILCAMPRPLSGARCGLGFWNYKGFFPSLLGRSYPKAKYIELEWVEGLWETPGSRVGTQWLIS